MKKSAIFILVFIATACTVSAHHNIKVSGFVDSGWSAKPKLHTIPKEYNREPAVVLYQVDKIDYKYEGKSTSIYHTMHRTLKILDERGVESFSTIRIPFYTSARIEELKARTITADGSVVNIPMHMFKVSQNEEGAPEIIFAMEGVSKNAEVEVFIKSLTPFSAFGSQYVQNTIPFLNYKLELSYPKNFIIEEKGFNGFPDASDTLIGGRKHMKINISDIPGVKQEIFSFIQPHLMRAEWRMSYLENDYGNDKRLYTWNEYAKRLFKDVFNLPDGVTPNQYFLYPKGKDLYRGDSERRAVNDFLNSIGVTGSETELQKIIKIEKGIKSKISLYLAVEDNSGRLDSIISRGSATTFGYLKLFVACFAQTDVKCEIGVTTNRRFHVFNSEFENWDNLQDYLFYFPNQKAFLSPTSILLRYPMVPEYIAGNSGVFCKMSTPSEARPRIADTRNVPAPTALESFSNLYADVNLTKNMDPEINVRYSYGGLETIPFRTFFGEQLNKDNQKRFIRKVISFVENQSDLVKYSTSNESIDSYLTKKPFEIIATVKAEHLMEKAGGKMVFNVGKLIGAQTELYEDKTRKYPVDLDYPHSSKRVINVTLPVGYHVQNLQDLKISHAYYDAENKKIPACSFTSNYTIKGNQLTITIDEIYSQIHYHLSDFSTYRKVINAAADFNKVSLVLGR